MKNSAKKVRQEIDYDKLNALSMYNKDLGEAYLNMDWDPLGPGFKLDLPYIEKYLRNARDKSEMKTPDFIEKNNKEVKKAFQNALKNNNIIRTELQNIYDLGEFSLYEGVNIESQVKDILFFLNCREQMLQIAIGKLKVNGINSLDAYKNIYNLNKTLSALLEETYRKEYNHKVLIQNMILQIQKEKQLENEQNNQHSQDKSKELLNELVGVKMRQKALSAMQIIENLVNTVTKTVDSFMGKE